MSDSFEEIRRKELEVQEKQLFAQRVTAVASVASAVAAHKQAAAVEEMREQMAVAAEREEEHRRQIAAQQRLMAEEQRLANFRNIVLTTLPLLKAEEEKMQFLTEQLFPKLQEKVDVKMFGPLELIRRWLKSESQMIPTHLKNEAGLNLDKFLNDGIELFNRIESWKVKSESRAKQFEEFEKAKKDLQEGEKSFRAMDLVKIGLWIVLFLIVFAFVIGGITQALNIELPGYETRDVDANDFTIGSVLLFGPILSGVTAHFLWKRRKIRLLKARVTALTPTDDGSGLEIEGKQLDEDARLQTEKWQTHKPNIVEYVVKKFHDYVNCDARSFLSERVVVPQLESGLQEVQSFLPPSSRLPAKHFAKFFFDESDVKECEASQSDLKKQLELTIEPFYKGKTIYLLLDRVGIDAAVGNNITTIKVGDLVEQMKDGEEADDLRGTVWKVLEVTDDFVNLELVSGEYRYDKPVFDGERLRHEQVVKLPGYSTKFSSCVKYREAHFGCKGNEEILKKWRRARFITPMKIER